MAGILREINLEYGQPTVDKAIKRLTFELHRGKSDRVGAIKLIHGYGSTGSGGKIRLEARKYLQKQKQTGFVKLVIEGERLSIFDEDTRKAFAVCGQLRGDHDMERHNNGITIVIF